MAGPWWFIPVGWGGTIDIRFEHRCAHELTLVGHVQHRQREPGSAHRNTAPSSAALTAAASTWFALPTLWTRARDRLEVDERRKIDGVKAGAEQDRVGYSVLMAVRSRALVKLDALAAVRGGRTFTCSQQPVVFDVGNRERSGQETQLNGIRPGPSGHR